MLEVGEQRLRLVLRAQKNRSGVWVAELLSLDHGNVIILVNAISFEGSTLRFDVTVIGATYEGQVNAEKSEITGQWKQGGVSRPLTLRRQHPG